MLRQVMDPAVSHTASHACLRIFGPPSMERSQQALRPHPASSPRADVLLPLASNAGLTDVPRQLLADISASHRQLIDSAHRLVSSDVPSVNAIGGLSRHGAERLRADNASRAVLSNLAIQQVTSGILSIHPSIPPSPSDGSIAKSSRYHTASAHERDLPRAPKPIENAYTS